MSSEPTFGVFGRFFRRKPRVAASMDWGDGETLWMRSRWREGDPRIPLVHIFVSEAEALASVPASTPWDIAEPGVRWKASHQHAEGSIEHLTLYPIPIQGQRSSEQVARLVMEYLDFQGDQKAVAMLAALANDVRPALRLLLEVEDREQ